MDQNTPKLWDTLWENNIPECEDQLSLAKEEKSIRWNRIKQFVLKEFGSFKNLKTIEIGAGAGTYSALMAKEDADVTLLDYSDKALQRSREFFKRNRVEGKFVYENALELPKDYFNKYDLSMSFGLTEHFIDQDRININKVHFQVIRNGGMSFISVPNKYNPPYRILKFICELTGRWGVGMEIPYSRNELRKICHEIGINEINFLGDSLFSSLQFVNPFRILKKFLKVKVSPVNIELIPYEKGSFLDEYFSYALIVVGKKTSQI